MRPGYKVFLDANVLANIAVCDLLLRLAEKPRQFKPMWSEKVLEEVYKVHTERLSWPQELAESFQKEVRSAFPNAICSDYQHLEPHMTNDPKDHHVLAAAIHSGASHLLTFNLKDFPPASIEPWTILVEHPQEYLLNLYKTNPLQVVSRIASISSRRGTELEIEILRLGDALPLFASRLLDDLKLG